MHYKELGRAACIDRESSGEHIPTDTDGCPTIPITIKNGAYEKALHTKNPRDIATFLTKWRTRTELDLTKLERHIKNQSQDLKALGKLDIVSVDLASSVSVNGQCKLLSDVIIDLFNTFSAISKQSGRSDYTASSKVLHALVPEFFVMWDNCIRCAYGCSIRAKRDAGKKYFTFLKRVQKEGREAVESYCADHDCTINEAIQSIRRWLYTGAFYSFTKILDQYNYQKYTNGEDGLWVK